MLKNKIRKAAKVLAPFAFVMVSFIGTWSSPIVKSFSQAIDL